MDAKARRNLGAHYTSEKNILKLIGPLFLDGLKAELDKAGYDEKKLAQLHRKLATLTFLDPACGCGNFLVIAYRELRALELEVLTRQFATQQSVLAHVQDHVLVDVDQFHGIEIEEFPAQIAQVALWLVDHQMNVRISEEFGMYFARIPLKTSPHIVHGNALTLDWNEVLPAERASYVFGNPPFVGKKEQSAAQKKDVEPLFALIKGSGVLDYVAAWYVKAACYMTSVRPELVEGQPFVHASTSSARTDVRCAFVSTNSITQGEQVGVLWGWLLAQGMHIHFAHRTFQWNNEAKGVAAVHCVIIGFGAQDFAQKVLFEYEDIRGEPHALIVHNINPYLVDAPDVLIANRNNPISPAPEINYGSFALDDGNYTLSESDREEILAENHNAENFIRPFIGGQELLHNIKRWCIWLVDAQPSEIRPLSSIMRRVESVQEWRSQSNRETTKKLAATPTRFAEIRQPKTNYIAIPTLSSEKRSFIPMAFLQANVIASNQVYVFPDASLFHFGILTSTMHNAWIRAVCGRLESRYRYSAGIVYNNFPWPDEPNDKQRAAIEAAAQAVLDARAQFPQSSLADLYDPLTMPPALVKAHQSLDRAVDACYRKAAFASDAQRVEFLFERYRQLTSLLPAETGRSKRKK